MEERRAAPYPRPFSSRAPDQERRFRAPMGPQRRFHDYEIGYNMSSAEGSHESISSIHFKSDGAPMETGSYRGWPASIRSTWDVMYDAKHDMARVIVHAKSFIPLMI